MKPLTQKQIAKYLKELPLWELTKKSTHISKTFKTKTFVQGLSFVAKVTVHAELLNHHPTVELTYSSVTVTTSTHDARGLTKLDFELAKRVDNLGL
jgi:4a-hydroxytetrahydrobiopterin dehydratase